MANTETPIPRLFGTDGVRGVAGTYPLDPQTVRRLGAALVRSAFGKAPAGQGAAPRTRILVGRDTRESGTWIEAELAHGASGEGAVVTSAGVVPTPAVAYLTRTHGYDAGVVISASHNPYGDNGIKLFSLFGTKLPVEVEADIERELVAVLADPDRPPSRPTGLGVGRLSRDAVAREMYAAHLVGTLGERRLDGLKVVVDCANGAASAIAPQVLAAVGASVTALHDAPDGVNINDGCGSTDPSELARAVVSSGADLGLALDGDADRVIAVDASGEIVDGDVLLALFALDLASREELAQNTVAVTVMTNLGFRLAMEARGIAVLETDVGDRHVLAALDAGGLTLGGEQSGHIIFRRLSTTGDGVLTGLALADLMARRGEGLASLAAGLVERVPQRLVNVRVVKPERLAECAEVWEAVVKAEAELGHTGRVLLRPSGTEPMVRVMVEAPEPDQADAVAAQLAGVVEVALGQA